MSAAQPNRRRDLARGIFIDLGLMTVIGIVLALIGPFGSFNDPLAIRLLVWIGFAWIGYILYSPIDTLAQRMAPVLDLPAWSLRAVACVLASVPMAIVVWALPRLQWPPQWPGAEKAFEHYLYVLMVGALITVVNTLVNRARGNRSGSAVAAAIEPPPTRSAGEVPDRAAPTADRNEPASSGHSPLLDQLPDELGSDIVALEMEDHYVRVHTSLGSDLVLMRLRDAMSSLSDVEGMQVHRSWWVARGAVEDVVRDGRNVRLKLARDIEAPVSRANVGALKDAGWI